MSRNQLDRQEYEQIWTSSGSEKHAHHHSLIQYASIHAGHQNKF